MIRRVPASRCDLLPVLSHNSDEVVPRIACQPEELLASFRLTYDAYVQAGLAWPNRHRLRVTRYQLESASEVLVAVKNDEVLATVSVIPDGRLGLPMEDIYPREVEAIRRSGARIAEVSCLADRPQKVERSLPVLLDLFKLVVQSARYRSVDKLVIAVHPRHEGFYRRIIGFTQVGGLRSYAAVLDRPAVALSLDLSPPNEQSTRAFRGFFADPFPAERLMRAVPRCQKFMERMRYFAAQQQRWEHEARFTDQPLPAHAPARPRVSPVPV